MTLLALTNQNKNHQKIISQWFKEPDGRKKRDGNGKQGERERESETHTHIYKEIERSKVNGRKEEEVCKSLSALKMGNIIIEITVRYNRQW